MITFLLIGVSVVFSEPYIIDPNFSVEPFVIHLIHPTSMEFIGDDILVLEKETGNVRLVRNGVLQKEPVLHVDVNSQAERGLLGITSNDNIVYLYFTEAEGHDGAPIANRIYKYTWDGETLQNGILIHELPLDLTVGWHNGGKMITGLDGTIFAVVGDAKHEGILQNFETGDIDDTSVILNVSVTESVLKPSQSENPLNYYYAMGIRNSFGLAIDPNTGYLWDTENGPADFDEINLVKPKFNSGWKKIMGPADKTEIKNPPSFFDFEYSDPEFSWEQTVAPTGLTFVDSSLFKEYKDYLLTGVFVSGEIYKFRLNSDRTGFIFEDPQLQDLVLNKDETSNEIIFGLGFNGITDLKFGPDNNLYILTLLDGTIHKVSPRIQKDFEIIIPHWIISLAEWWSTDKISDDEFTNGIEYLVENNIIMLSKLPEVIKVSDVLNPSLPINMAKQWSNEQISDEEFVSEIEYWIGEGIIWIDKDLAKCGYIGINQDISGCDLSEKNLSGKDLSFSNMKNTILRNSNLEKIKMVRADLSEADLSNSNARGASFQGANLDSSNLSGINLEKATLSSADIRNADLGNAKLSGAIILNVKMQNSNLKNAELSGIQIRISNFNNVNLTKSMLVGTNLDVVQLENADMSFSNLTNARIHGSNLTNAKLIGSDLSGATLSMSDLFSADLTDSTLVGATIERTKMREVKLTNTNLTDSVLSIVQLNKAKLFGTIFVNAELKEVNLRESLIQNVDFSGASLIDVNLGGAELNNVNFHHANLSNANFENTKMTNVDFTEAITIGCKGCQ